MRIRSATLVLLAALLPPSMALAGAPAASLPAFPGAEGYGAGASGGRGGTVYEVTNLDDSGPGSFRDAVKEGNRTIVFRVSGTINLQSRLEVRASNITIAGQSAPGNGICLRGYELFLKNSENIIVRFIRFRPGDESKTELDAVTVWNCKNVILDHCSMSWSTDSINDVVKQCANVTVQWCVLSEPLVKSVHAKGSHGYATGWHGLAEGGGGSYHHNLIAHAASRAPRIGYDKAVVGLIDCRNNVIYNCGPSYGGENGQTNFVGNYYRPGPETRKARPEGELFDIWSDDARMYIEGNAYEGSPSVAADNRSAIAFKRGKTSAGEGGLGGVAICLVDKPFGVAPVTTHSAAKAYEFVVQFAGAVLPRRDFVDSRIINDVKNRTGKFINSQSEVGGWPELKSTTPPADGDHDGMPDDWEKSRGLNPADPTDGAKQGDAKGYTNLELYLNELATAAFPSAK